MNLDDFFIDVIEQVGIRRYIHADGTASDERFYEAIKELRHIGNNLNQIAKKANYLNYVDSSKYGEEVNKLNSFIIRIKKEFLIGEKCD